MTRKQTPNLEDNK
uniref:Uncharacterized protein n=1 Tax=Anguilla anguilla TaxID=7936 RepID=A0A0E9U8X8_ANGAN